MAINDKDDSTKDNKITLQGSAMLFGTSDRGAEDQMRTVLQAQIGLLAVLQKLIHRHTLTASHLRLIFKAEQVLRSQYESFAFDPSLVAADPTLREQVDTFQQVDKIFMNSRGQGFRPP